MQRIFATLLDDLHAFYFKPNGFKKQRHHFRRHVPPVLQEIGFQSPRWCSIDSLVTSYVNIRCGFTDVLGRSGGATLSGQSRLGDLVAGAPAEFYSCAGNYSIFLDQLLHDLAMRISVLPKSLLDHPQTRATRL